MSDYVIPDPEPKPIDEKQAIELRHLADNAVLKAHPSGDERCENCLYYLENSAELVLLAPQAAHPGGWQLVVPVVGGDPGDLTPG